MKLYSIGQASEMIGVPIATIRYYESVELCSPSFTDGSTGYRYYSIDDIFKLDLIRCLGRQLGVPLKQIRSFLKESQDPEAIKRYLQQQEQAIDRQIEELSRRRIFISDKLTAIRLREELSFLEPGLETLEELELYTHRIEADSLEDAILLARKAAADRAEDCREIYLIIDKVPDPAMYFRSLVLTVGLQAESSYSSRLILPAGSYASVYYPNRDDCRQRAYEALFAFIRDKGLRTKGSIICSGSLIDTTSASSQDYVIKISVRVEPAEG